MGTIMRYSGKQVTGIEVVLSDGVTVTGEEVTIADEGVYVTGGGGMAMYPWHGVKEVRGLPPRRQPN